MFPSFSYGRSQNDLHPRPNTLAMLNGAAAVAATSIKPHFFSGGQKFALSSGYLPKSCIHLVYVLTWGETSLCTGTVAIKVFLTPGNHQDCRLWNVALGKFDFRLKFCHPLSSCYGCGEERKLLLFTFAGVSTELCSMHNLWDFKTRRKAKTGMEWFKMWV